jgi:hypothetical protein
VRLEDAGDEIPVPTVWPSIVKFTVPGTLVVAVNVTD